MFGPDYSAAPFIKKLARIIFIASLVIATLLIITSLVILCIDAQFLGFLALTLFLSAPACIIGTLITANLLWGYAEIIDNSTKKDTNDFSQLPPL